LTAQGCPAHTFISNDVKTLVSKIPGVKSANVQVVWEPPWDVSRMSEAAKKQLGMS
jgi:metal-sulfur cluster biosynthetic enzyme